MPVNRVIDHDFVDTTAVTYCFQPVPSGILRYYTITLLFKKKKRVRLKVWRRLLRAGWRAKVRQSKLGVREMENCRIHCSTLTLQHMQPPIAIREIGPD